MMQLVRITYVRGKVCKCFPWTIKGPNMPVKKLSGDYSYCNWPD